MVRPIALGLGLLSALGCSSDRGLVVRTNEPMLYVSLSRHGMGPQDTIVAAVLGTTGVPTRFEYRDAEQFEMRRLSDGRRFAWVKQDLDSTARSRYLPAHPNFVLASAATPLGLGREDLSPGERYELQIVSKGRTIDGWTTIPGVPEPIVREQDGAIVVAWPPVTAAAAYIVYGKISQDTFYVLGRPGESIPEAIAVTAIDTNYFRFASDPAVTAAGLSGAFGLVASHTTTVVRTR